MPNVNIKGRLRLAAAAAAMGLALAVPATPAAAASQPTVVPTEEVTLSVGTGRLVPLGRRHGRHLRRQ
jgi:hypothetical protein